MAEHDPDSRGWLRSHPLARDLVRSAEADVPAPGFEERLLGRLRSDRDGTNGAVRPMDDDSEFGAVDAVTDQRVRALEPQPETGARKESPIPARSRTRFTAYVSVGALAAAAAFAIWILRGPSDQGPELSARAVRSPATQAVPNAGPPCEKAVRADSSLTLIDDFEDGNARMLAHGGRFGTWSFITADAPHPPLALPLAPELIAGSSHNRRALHARSDRRHDFSAVWATLGPACYDASAFAGIRFTGKGPAKIALRLSPIDTVERKYGGVCEADCDHPHRMRLQLTDRFQSYEVLFRDLAQGPEVPAVARRALDVRRLNAFAFVVDGESESFDFWIDDVEWIVPD